jgi:hypothetical protein
VWDRQRARQRRGLGLERDKLHGRVVDRRRVVEMAPPSMLDSVVNGRASGPGPAAPARVSAFFPKRVGRRWLDQPRRSICVAASGPRPAARARVSGFSCGFRGRGTLAAQPSDPLRRGLVQN